MKKTSGWLSMLCPMCAWALAVGPWDVGTIDVPVAATQESVLTVGPGGTLYKTGAGLWTVPFGMLGWEPEMHIAVQEGGLALTSSAETPAAVPAPEDVIGPKALFWIDASLTAAKPDLFVTRAADGKTYLDSLYDVRETDVANRTRPYAEAQHEFRYVKEGLEDGKAGNCATSNNAAKVLSPEIVSRDGKTALYFGGVGSGRKMSIIRAGKTTAESTKDVIHLFLVTDVVDGWGNPVSGLSSSGIYWGSASKSLSNPLLSVDSSAWFLGNRTYVNGERIDPLTERPRKGFQIFECELTAYKCTASSLYTGGTAANAASCKIAADDDGSRATAVQLGGGDYLYEFIAFTNRLTGAERQRVAEYLRRKWATPVTPRFDLDMADGTSLTLDIDGAMTNPVKRAARVALEKKGTGVLTVARDRRDPALHYADITLTGGAIDFQAAAPICAKAGCALRAEPTDGANRVTASAAARADGFEKIGRGDALVRSLPNEVTQLDVTGGRLVIHPVETAGGSSDTPDLGEIIDIPNADFEDWSGTDKAGAWGNDFWTPWKGWTLLAGVESKSNSYLFNYDNWKALGAGWANNSLGTCAITCRPPSGSCALMMRTSKTSVCGVMTREALTLPAGRYAFDYWSSCSGTRTGAIVDIVLVDAVTKDILTVGRQPEVYRNKGDGYGPVRILFDVAVGGRYHLGFRNAPTGAAWNTLLMTLVDKLSLRRLPASAGRWPIPGGDMEQLTFPNPGAMTDRVFSTAIAHEAWTLTQPAGAEQATGTDLGVGFATCYHHDQDANVRCFYNDSRYPERTAMMTFFKSGARAQTTFTPPAGTWRLEACLAENGQTPNHTLTATATVDGTPIALGAIDPNTKIFSVFTFAGGTVTVDGKTPVTLSLAYTLSTDGKTGSALAALYLDDLALVRVDAPVKGCVEYARADRDGHATLNYGFISPSSEDLGTAVNYGQFPAYAGDGFGGTSGFIVRNRGGLWFEHTFPGPGTYRFSFTANNVSTATGVNPVKVYLVAAGETNLLGVVKARAKNQVEYAFTFRIAAGGDMVRRFVLTGSNTGWVDEEGASSGDAVIDNVSVAAVPAGDLVETDCVFSAASSISVADRAQLTLDFIGTNAVEAVSLGGRHVYGLIDSRTYPAYLSGPGALFVAPPGITIIIR